RQNVFLQWAAAIESLDYDSRSDKSFGMKQRPDGDIEIDEKFWEEDFHIPTCQKCNGILKPDVRFFASVKIAVFSMLPSRMLILLIIK
ncbi:unnamed protein product, partial [Ilex paraguariensis]